MIDILKEVDIDIKRCEDVIKENNYLEIVIAIEELNDKYRARISELSNGEFDNVWNYSKKDLENIEKSLIKYEEEIIEKNKNKTIKEKLDDLIQYLNNNNIKNKDELIKEINLIEDIYYKEISLDKKWNELKISLDIIKTIDREVGIYILEIILLIILKILQW